MTLEEKCLKHWQQMGIDSITAIKKTIETIFQKHSHQEYVLIDIYKLVFPEWDRIERIKGYPEAGNDLWNFICRLFMEFDRKHHPDCFAGGAWMNIGFSVNPALSPWDICFRRCQVVMK